jgi:hypothetical protein
LALCHLTLHDSCEGIGGVIVAVGTKESAIGDKMLVKLWPLEVPPLGHTYAM